MKTSYNTPNYELQHNDNYPAIDIFPRFRVWAMIGLSVVTLGIYLLYWMISRTTIMNEQTDYTISQAFVSIAFFLFIFALLGQPIGFILPEAYGLILAKTVLSLVATIWLIVFAFKIRNRINLMSSSIRGEPAFIKGIFTVLFGPFYLQFKINQMIEINDGF